MTSALRWNPVAMATHNGERWPRVVHHLTHILLGAGVWVGAWLASFVFGGPYLVPLLGCGMLVAVLDKCEWVDVPDRRLVWTGWPKRPMNWPDFAADLGFTLIGATVACWGARWWVALPVYYVLSLFSDP